MLKFPLDARNCTETAYANGIDYTYEFLPDGWIAIWERSNGVYRPIIQACNQDKADELISFREPVPCNVQKLV